MRSILTCIVIAGFLAACGEPHSEIPSSTVAATSVGLPDRATTSGVPPVAAAVQPTRAPQQPSSRAAAIQLSPATQEQSSALEPAVEACLRRDLSPAAFREIFKTGSRNETAAEEPVIGACFEGNNTDGSGSGAGQYPATTGDDSEDNPQSAPSTHAGAPPQEDDGPALDPAVEACLRRDLSPAAFREIFETGSRNETAAEQPVIRACFEGNNTDGSGSGAGQGPATTGEQSLSQDQSACVRAALGPDAFRALILQETRIATPAEAETMTSCRTNAGMQTDMPVYDLRTVYKPDLYPRTYPRNVIGTGGQAWFELMALLSDDTEVDRLRRAGVNTIHTVVLYDLDDTGAPTINRPKEAANLIIRARIRNFAVYLTLDTFTVDVPCEASQALNLDSWNDIRRKAAIALAQFADELNVEYMSPANETEGSLQSPCLYDIYSQQSGREPYQQMLDPRGEEGLSARVEVTSSWYTEILTDIRAVFGGKVFSHYGTIHPDVLTPGYDGIAFTLDHGHLSEQEFRQHVRSNYASASEASMNSSVPMWIVSAYLPFSLEQDRLDPEHPDYDPNYVRDEDEDQRMRAMQGMYTAVSLNEFPADAGDGSENFVDASGVRAGFVLGGWVDKGLEISGSDSEASLVAQFG